MTQRKRFVTSVVDFFGDVRAARHCANAIEAGRKPPEAALRRLGLNREMFDQYH